MSAASAALGLPDATELRRAPHRRGRGTGTAEQRRMTRHVHVLGICGYATFGAAMPRARPRRPRDGLGRPCLPADERRRHRRRHRVGEPERPRQPRPLGDTRPRGGRQSDAPCQPRACRRARARHPLRQRDRVLRQRSPPTASGSPSAGRTGRRRPRRCSCTSSTAPGRIPGSGSDRHRSTSGGTSRLGHRAVRLRG